MSASPILHQIGEQAGVMAWRWPEPMRTLSSAPVNGGLVVAQWLVNIGVPVDYSRIDLDAHAAEVADELGLVGPGTALLTAADVRMAQRAEEAGVVVDTTVGISKPTWAADPDGGYTPWQPGTINIVIQLDVTLTDAAAVNAVITATEAKTQALIDADVPGTGTASDAIVIVMPTTGRSVPFAGPRSEHGSAIAQAVHRAVADGIAAGHVLPYPW